MLRKIKSEVDKLVQIAEIFDSAGEYNVSERIFSRLTSYTNKRYAQFEDDEIEEEVQELPEPQITSPQIITPENKFDNTELGHIKIDDWYQHSPYDLANLFLMSLSKGNDINSSFGFLKQDLPSNLESFFETPIDVMSMNNLTNKVVNEALSLSFGKFFSPTFYSRGTLIHLIIGNQNDALDLIKTIIEVTKTHTADYEKTRNEVLFLIQQKDPSVDYNLIFKYLYYKMYDSYSPTALARFKKSCEEFINAVDIKQLQIAINLYLEYNNVRIFENPVLYDMDKILDALSLYDISIVKQAFEIYKLPTEYYNYSPTIKEIARGFKLDNELKYKKEIDEFSRKNPMLIRFPKKLHVDMLMMILNNFQHPDDIKELVSNYDGSKSVFQLRNDGFNLLVKRGEVPEALLRAQENDPNFEELSATAVNLYKINPQKLITIFSSGNKELIQFINYENIYPCNPDKLMDFIIPRADSLKHFNYSKDYITTLGTLNNFPILYSNFGERMYDFDEGFLGYLAPLCIHSNGTVQIDDIDFLFKVYNRPDVKRENIIDAVKFYSDFPDLEASDFQEINNLTNTHRTTFDKIGVILQEFGDIYTVDALIALNAIKGSDNRDVENIRFIISKIKNLNFGLGSINRVLNKLPYTKIDSQDESLDEILIILDNPYAGLDFEEGKLRIQQVKNSIQKLAEKNPQYAQLREGTREYSVVMRMLYYNLSLAGKSPDIIIGLVDKCLKGLYIEKLGLDQYTLQLLTSSLNILGIPTSIENLLTIKRYHDNIKEAQGVMGLCNQNQKPFGELFFYIIQNYGIVKDYESVINDIFGMRDEKPFAEIPKNNGVKIEVNPDSLNKFFDDRIVHDLYHLSNCIALFGKLTEKFLNKFYLPKFNSMYDTHFTDFNQITDDYNYKFETLLKDLIPNITYKTQGYAQYYLNQATYNNLKQMFLIAKYWSTRIDIYNDKYEVVMPEKEVSEIAYQFTPEDLSTEIRIYLSLLLDFDKIKAEGVDKKFFALYLDAADNENRGSTNTDDLITLHKIYQAGKSVEKADWMKYDNTIKQGKYALRGYFLSNNDPKGMWLGDISRCCQHPYGAAVSCSIDGIMNPNAGFFVFELNRELCLQAYVWADKFGNICFDSLETIGEKSYHSDTVKDMIKIMLEDFGSKQESKVVVVGSPKILFFPLRNDYPLRNSSTAHTNNFGWIDYASDIYTDASTQSIISDNRDEETRNRFNEYHSIYDCGGFECPVCGTSKKTDKCRYCGWTPEEYQQCVYCGNHTWDPLQNKCVANQCDNMRNIQNTDDEEDNYYDY